MDELIDVVNEHDEVLFQKSISVCHQQQLLHRGSSILIFSDNSYSSLLLQKRSSFISFPGQLCLPGGHLVAGESYLQGAKRELQEELFYRKSLPTEILLEPIGKIRKNADHDPEFDFLFRTIYAGPFFSDTEEVESFNFYDALKLKNEIKQGINNPSQNPLKYTETTQFLLLKYFQKYSP